MTTLSVTEKQAIDAWWRAANYLSVGQIYLLDNPLLHRPLELAHVKPRLLGHWGTTPGLNFIYAHMNRAILRHQLNVIYFVQVQLHYVDKEVFLSMKETMHI